MILMTGIRVQNRGNQAVEHQFCGISASPGGGTDLEHSASRWAAVPPMEQPSAPAGAKVYAFVDHLGHHPIEGSVQTGGAFMLTVIVASGGDAVALEAIPRAHVGSWTAPQLPGEQIVRALPPAPTRAAPRTEPTAPLKMDVLGNRPESYAKEPASVAQQPLSSGPRAIEIAPPQESIGRDQFAGAAENAIPHRAGGTGLDLLHRCRHRLIFVRPRLAQPQRPAAASGGADRGARQLFPLRV